MLKCGIKVLKWVLNFFDMQIEDGDIICFQKSPSRESEEQCRYPDVPSFLEYVHNRQVLFSCTFWRGFTNNYYFYNMVLVWMEKDSFWRTPVEGIICCGMGILVMLKNSIGVISCWFVEYHFSDENLWCSEIMSI